MKKSCLWLLVLMVALLVAGCACQHEETQLIHNQTADCVSEGYTGDIQCVKCQEIVTPGEVIAPLGHTAGEPTDVREADCTNAGYTGDILCTVCGETLESGAEIAATGHTPADRTGIIEPTCTEEGYTGDVLCAVCGETLEAGEAVAALGHQPGERMYVETATCTKNGYTGDVYCTVCNEMLEHGEVTADAEAHTPAETLTGVAEATCASEGYTGDILCVECGAVLTAGSPIAKLEHVMGEPVSAVEATCTQAGYSGDVYCQNCRYAVWGETIEMLPHDFVDHVCSMCSWLEPGLYDGETLLFDWQQLCDSELITTYEEDGEVHFRASTNLSGQLVVDESVTWVGYSNFWFEIGEDSLRDCTGITEVYLPKTIKRIGEWAFRGSGVEKVHFFGTFDMVHNAFGGCVNLKEIVLPEGVTAIGPDSFKGCTALEKVVIPSTVEYIGDSAFSGCASLKALDLPENLATVGQLAFENTGITQLTLPASVTWIGQEYSNYARSGFAGCSALESLDLSACQVERLGSTTFAGCGSLKQLKLPLTLRELGWNEFDGCASLETLILPQGFETWEIGDYEKLAPATKTLVWPVSFVDTYRTIQKMPALETIYYEGSEAQWAAVLAVAGADAFSHVQVIFDYDYNTPIG